MCSAKFFSIFLIATTATIASAEEAPDNALQLLDRVASHYEQARTIYFKAIVRQTVHSDFSNHVDTSLLTAYTAPDGRFRYDGIDASGSGLIVSDGTNEWFLMRSFAQYVKQPTGTVLHGRTIIYGDNKPLFDARNLLYELIGLGTHVRSAHFLHPEQLKANGRLIRCAVVQFGTKDSTSKPHTGQTEETTIWIDTAALTVLKQQSTYSGKTSYGSQYPPFASTFKTTITTTYSETKLDLKQPPGLFTFTPPAGSQEVVKLPTPLHSDADAKLGTSSESSGMLGKPLPSLKFHDINGAEVPISRYIGHPLLIDVWATWCGPCINEFPILNTIRQSTAQTDLQLLAIDEDVKSADAVALLKRRGYAWKDLHDNNTMLKQFSTKLIPLIVLTNATGEIVYVNNGAGDAKGLAAAISNLGQDYKSVRIN